MRNENPACIVQCVVCLPNNAFGDYQTYYSSTHGSNDRSEKKRRLSGFLEKYLLSCIYYMSCM